MTDKAPSGAAAKRLSLSEADISSRPSAARRSMLGALGVSGGIAAATAFEASGKSPAADVDGATDTHANRAQPDGD
jgi:hypothetical protein